MGQPRKSYKTKGGPAPGITYQYDGDGNRVSKTIGGVKTTYLVDTFSPTGYADVLEESRNGQVQAAYAYGPMRAWVIYPANTYSDGYASITPIRYYGYDGHGSVRYLTGETGAVVHTYDYDAYGNVVNETDTPAARDWQHNLVIVPANTMMFAGEQWDADLGLYYNRARYLDVRVGRFWGMDVENENPFSPADSNAYVYANADPVNRTDPSGQDTIAEVNIANAALFTLATTTALYLQNVLQKVKVELPFRANHYTRWKVLPSIMASGINSPGGTNYFTTDYYLFATTAKAMLAMKDTPQLTINLWLFRYKDDLHGPTEVDPKNGEPGGGEEYWTTQPIPFWQREPVVWPLF